MGSEEGSKVEVDSKAEDSKVDIRDSKVDSRVRRRVRVVICSFKVYVLSLFLSLSLSLVVVGIDDGV